MQSIPYIIGILLCIPYIIYVTIKNDGNINNTIKQVYSLIKTDSHRDEEILNKNYRIRVFLLFAMLAFLYIGYMNLTVLKYTIIAIVLTGFFYYLINPGGVVKHIIVTLKEIYPSSKK